MQFLMCMAIITVICENDAEQTEDTWLKISDGVILIGMSSSLDPYCLHLRYVKIMHIIY